MNNLSPVLTRSYQIVQRYGLLFLMLSLVSATVVASTGSSSADFQQIYDLVKGWTQGTLGNLIAVSAFLVGMAVGIMRQSIMAVVAGLGFAVALAYAPNIIEAIFTFTI